MSITITAAVIGVVAASTLGTLGQLAASKHHRHNYVVTLRAARWWMVPAAIANVSIVLLIALAIPRIAPWSWWGWWKLLGGTPTNVWLGQSGQTGLWWQIAGFAIPLCLLVVLPMMAYGEEMMFRWRSEKLSIPVRIRTQLRFGFLHCLVCGVPLAAGLALTASGFYFERIYLREIRSLKPKIEAAEHMPEFVPTPYPERSSGPGRDAAALDRHKQAYDTVAQANRHRLEEWLKDLPARAEEKARRVHNLEEQAIAKAAAAHAISNALLIGALLIVLLTHCPR